MAQRQRKLLGGLTLLKFLNCKRQYAQTNGVRNVEGRSEKVIAIATCHGNEAGVAACCGYITSSVCQDQSTDLGGYLTL